MSKSIILVGLGLIATGCGSDQPAPSPNSDFIVEMARKTRGDATKLTPEERAKMDELTNGKTEDVLRWHPATNMQPVSPPSKS